MVECFKRANLQDVILAIILLIIMGSLRPDQPLGLCPNKYWALKSEYHHCADMVLAGDSRVLIGLSPAELNKGFKNKRIYNYGFAAAWFSEEYLDAIENVLDPKGKDKIIILAITPHALTERKEGAGNFFEADNLSEWNKFMNIHFPKIMNFFEPLSLKDALEGLIPSIAKSHTTKTYYKNGWLSIHREPIQTKRELKRYRGFYNERLVIQENVERVLKYVVEWKNKGIKVFGLVFPTCKQMYELENEISGFNEKEFISLFKEVGGCWIDVDQTAYTSYDGCHLQLEAAVKFSNDFAELLNKAWNDQTNPLTKKSMNSDNCDSVKSPSL